MLDAYLTGKDLYAVIAQSAFNNNYEDNLEFYAEGTEIDIGGNKIITGKKTHKRPGGKDRRSIGKVLLLASTYGMSGATAGARMGKTKEEGQELLDNFFKGFPQVKNVIDQSKKNLKDTGFVEDWAGRRRHLKDYFLPPYEITYKDPEKVMASTFNPILVCSNRTLQDNKTADYLSRASTIKSNKDFEKLAKEADAKGYLLTANTGRIAQAERQCFNARIQGGAASLTKLAMINIDNDERLKKYDAHLIITVHDEVLVECPACYADEVEKILPEIMIDTAKPYINVPMSCDPYNVSRWYIDEYSAMIQEEFKKLNEGNEEKGIKSMSHDEALQEVINAHPELPESEVRATIEEGRDMNF